MEDIRVGLTVRALRRRQGLRQSDLARAAEVAQSTVSRLERGHLDQLAMATVRNIFTALDATVELAPRWRGGEVDRLLDARHAAIGTAAASVLEGLGWVTVPEVTYSVYGERGSIDLVALREAESIAVMLEVKTSINSVEELLRKTDAKARLLPGLVFDRFGWRPASVVRIWSSPMIAPTGDGSARWVRCSPRASPARPSTPSAGSARAIGAGRASGSCQPSMDGMLGTARAAGSVCGSVV